MGEINEAGYVDLRAYIVDNWKFIELRDENDAAVVRLETTDPRVDWKTSEGQTLELRVVITGSDADITLDTQFKSSALYKVAADGDAFSEEEFTPFTIGEDEDEMTVIHRIQVPEVI